MMPVTQGLLFANIAVFLLEASGMMSLGAFALWPPGGFESNFQPWQLVTYAFLHGGLSHIFFNMLGLYMFGSEIERLFGSRFYAAYYVGCVVSAALCHLAVTAFMGGPGVPMVGASGGVYGLLLAFGTGGCCCFFHRSRCQPGCSSLPSPCSSSFSASPEQRPASPTSRTSAACWAAG
jgi:membrane associated rhomboid family serine protease